MADDPTLPYTGSVAGDDIAGKLYQRMKLTDGKPDSTYHLVLEVSTSTDISLSSSTTSAQLVAANSARRGMILTNTDEYTCYLYYGTTATASKFTVPIPPGGYWEMPVWPVWTGRIDVIWAGDGPGGLIGSEY